MAPVDIWTEKLEQRHLALLERWIGRTAGRMTTCDLPDNPDMLPQWYEGSEAEAGRRDCLVLAYDTPIGIAGFRKTERNTEEAELYLMLGEANYNLIRTATYATIRILDQAFQDYHRIIAMVYDHHEEYLSALNRMGFSQSNAEGNLIAVSVEKTVFQSRKYLF